jgi:hypothetical protein
MTPNSFGKEWRKNLNQGKIFAGQGEHWSSFLAEDALAYSAFVLISNG